jgi:acetyl/propionyl-CoA carboxylase alpha subunit
VEHPVTELVTGLDLVRAQIQLALTGELIYTQADLRPRGWAIEARLLAEDPEQSFMPSTGVITHLQEPSGPGVRVDSALYMGMPVSGDYDSLLAKVIAYGENRPVALARLRRALSEFQLGGVATDLEFLLQILRSQPFIAGTADTTFLDTFSPVISPDRDALEREIALAAALLAHQNRGTADHDNPSTQSSWQAAAWREQMGNP